MIEVTPYTLPELIPQHELAAFRSSIKKIDFHCPPEVKEFIEALSSKLDDFMQFGREQVFISGKDLRLSGMHYWKGEKVFSAFTYRLDVPKMIACDHRAAMYKIFHKRGKQGLIDFCQAKVKGTELQRLLQVLNVHVFHQERKEFRKIMAEIDASKKLERDLQV